MMDINDLFGNRMPAVESGRPVAATPSLVAAPLLFGLEKESAAYRLIYDRPAGCTTRLKQGEVHLALIPSIDYAEGKGNWLIVPDLCVSARGAAKTICLFFNEGVQRFRTIAIDRSARSEAVLLKILLNERYQNSPEYMYMDAGIEHMLAKADAALVVGDAALQLQRTNPRFLDLGEEWFDFSGLPFVSSFWCGHELALTAQDVERLQASFMFGRERRQAICEQYAKKYPIPVSECYDYLENRVQYRFGKEEQEGLKEFYRYAFYLGYIDHIPDLHFWQEI